MASVTLDFPDAHQTRIIDALCLDGGWSQALGVTKAAFAKQHIARMVRDRVREVELAQARQAALSGVTPPPEVTIT